MRNRKRLLIVLFLLLDIFIVGFVIYNFQAKPEKAHFHAGFQVYADGKLQNFSDAKYMKEAPCTLEGTDLNEDVQMDKAHLHDMAGNVAHAHVKGGKWEDLFKNIKYTFPDNKPVEGYVNGKAVNNILQYQINPYDSIIIVVGSQPNDINTYLKGAVTRDEIVTEEKKSENCGT